ncbi:hypothetical protein BHE74_00049408 [Ensete ventricosum]|nr:hypothetical protein BHE74_00049408 [Ensete ventricosum]
MKADHDLDTTVIEGSLAVIRERYNISVEYRLHVPWSGQRPYSLDALEVCITVDALEDDRMDLGDLQGMPKMPGGKALVARSVGSTQGVGGVPPIEVPKPSSKRPYGPPVPSDDPSRRHKKVKILSRKHKSRCGEEGSRLHSKGKEPAEPVEEPEMLGDSVEEDVSPVFHRPRSMKDLFKTKVHKDDTGYYALHISKTVAKVEERASELEKELEKTKRKQDEALQRLEASDRELNKVRSNLSEIQRLLKEAWVRAQKMDDELL